MKRKEFELYRKNAEKLANVPKADLEELKRKSDKKEKEFASYKEDFEI